MCDYSLQAIKSRDAVVGERLTTYNFGTGTRGFTAEGKDCGTAICLKPGTELSFPNGLPFSKKRFFEWLKPSTVRYQTARFRQINKDKESTHHDALEFPDGSVELLTDMPHGVEAVVLQLPAPPRNMKEEIEQKRVAFVG